MNLMPVFANSQESWLLREDKVLLAQLMEEKQRRVSQRKLYTFYPEEGPLSRHNYPKHMRFFEAGRTYRERAAMAANRVGKTEGMGGYELTLHLTGQYPDWWVGRRFSKPIKAWAAGDTNQTTRDILQAKLFGPIDTIGTGLIPGDCIVDYKRKASSVPDTIETAYIRHVSGGISVLGLKSYEQGRKSFQGTEQDVILLDEEPAEDIYLECLTRTMTTHGLIMLTFTPLSGVSNVVLLFMPGGQVPKDGKSKGRFMVSATWDDAPHLTEADKKELFESYPVHMRDARSKGIPALGSGAIYPIAEENIVVPDFPLPAFYPRVYAFDPGWNCTAALWGAIDRENDIIYLYSEYKRGQAEPAVHADAIRARGDWIPGVSDPAARASNQKDGEKLLKKYRELGLKLALADNAVEAGLLDVFHRMTSGRLKVFASLVEWLGEFRLYRRDEKGKVVKENDHLMDDTRYLVRSGVSRAKDMPYEIYDRAQKKAKQDIYQAAEWSPFDN